MFHVAANLSSESTLSSSLCHSLYSRGHLSSLLSQTTLHPASPQARAEKQRVHLPEVSPKILGGWISFPLLLGLVEGSVVLTPTGVLFQGSRDSVTPLVCSVMAVAVLAVVVVVVATVVFCVCKMETVVGPNPPGKVLDSRASSSPVGPQAMNSVSVVGLPPRKSKSLNSASCVCLLPRLRRLCCSAVPAATMEDEADAEGREGLDPVAAGGFVSPPLGPRVATWSLGLWALRARGVCICMGPWARSARAARGLQAGVGSLVGGPLRRLHSRWGLCGRESSRNSGPGPNESQDGKSTTS